MRAFAILGILATTAGAEPLKPVVATFGGVTRVLPHGRMITSGRVRIVVLTETALGCADQRVPPASDYSILIAIRDENINFIAFKTKSGTAIGHGTVDMMPVRDRATIGTIDASGGSAEAHGAFDLIVCPADKGHS